MAVTIDRQRILIACMQPIPAQQSQVFTDFAAPL
jgi:predicted YcjX-like family ATPase